MSVMMQCIHNENYANTRFPVAEKELQILCDALEIPNTAETKIKIGSVSGNEKLSALLLDKTVKLDELNYLMKRLDSFSDGEWNIFHAVAAGEKLTSLEELINLTFNTHCYSLVDDFSDLDRLGKDLYLNKKGSVSSKELDELDGKAYVASIMAENPAPMVTPYGLVYENGNELETLYYGSTFPAYWYDANPITVRVCTASDTEYLYLPVEKSEVDKALQRLKAESLEKVAWNIEEHTLPDHLAKLVIADKTEFADLNQFAAVFKKMGVHEVKSLSELAAFANITTAEQLKTLADCMYEFERFSGIHSAEAYGRYMICNSGRFEYDDNLEAYIDFGRYGQDKISHEAGVFTDRGYLVYHGYSQEMQAILHQTMGMQAKEIPEPQELKLYMPLKIFSYQEEDMYGHFEQTDVENELLPYDIAKYQHEIIDAIERNKLPEEEKRGLMEYYGKNDSVNAKVKRYDFSAEFVGDKLMGVVIAELNAPLDDREMKLFKEAVIGQAADGFGEGFEQREIECGDRDVYVSFWSSDKNWSLQTAEELGIGEQNHTIQFGGM